MRSKQTKTPSRLNADETPLHVMQPFFLSSLLRPVPKPNSFKIPAINIQNLYILFPSSIVGLMSQVPDVDLVLQRPQIAPGLVVLGQKP